MDTLVEFKNSIDDFEVEFEVLPAIDSSNETDIRKANNNAAIQDIDDRMASLQERIDFLNKDIDRLTNHADGIDLALSATSGIICGIIDAVVVGEWDFEKAKAKSNEDVNNKVSEFVKKDPRYIPWCENTQHGRKARNPDRLESAIEFLEEHYHLPGDSAYQNGNFGITGNNHRLDDFCHHPTLVGLICSVIVQFSGSAIYSHNSGETIRIPITVNEYGKLIGNSVPMKILCGVINWFLGAANAIANQQGHLMSDIATPAGLPGSFLSTLKELSALPCFKGNNFAENLRKAYQNGIGTGKSQLDLGVFNSLFEGASSKFDKRTEMAVANELKRQALPVIINEVLVRGVYFIRRFIGQMKTKKTLDELDWKQVLPFRNRTIVRMLTVATGTFTAFDLADAAIETAVRKPEACSNPASFFSAMILRVNFVGIGRFAIAVATDVGMGIKRSSRRKERIMLCNEQLQLIDAKMYYKLSNMWIAAEETGKTMEEAFVVMEDSIQKYSDAISDICDSFDNINDSIDAIVDKNPDFAKKMLEALEW